MAELVIRPEDILGEKPDPLINHADLILAYDLDSIQVPKIHEKKEIEEFISSLFIELVRIFPHNSKRNIFLSCNDALAESYNNIFQETILTYDLEEEKAYFTCNNYLNKLKVLESNKVDLSDYLEMLVQDKGYTNLSMDSLDSRVMLSLQLSGLINFNCKDSLESFISYTSKYKYPRKRVIVITEEDCQLLHIKPSSLITTFIELFKELQFNPGEYAESDPNLVQTLPDSWESLPRYNQTALISNDDQTEYQASPIVTEDTVAEELLKSGVRYSQLLTYLSSSRILSVILTSLKTTVYERNQVITSEAA